MSAIDRVGGWSAVLGHLITRADLTSDQARCAMESILEGEATSAQIAALLVALRTKGETSEELGGMLEAVLAASGTVELPEAVATRAIDIVGTGGDASHSVNVSTMASLVVAGAGVPVCKHGNRASSSRCGTADVLERLGVKLEQTGEGVTHCVTEAGMGFAFAPVFHPAFRHAGPTRKELGIPTALNLLGPMANPARVAYMVVGVGHGKFTDVMAHTLLRRGVTRAWVVHGHGGLDELSLSGPNHVLEVRDGRVTTIVVDPHELGLDPADLSAIRGGDPEDNARIVRETFDGALGAVRDIVVLNAAAGLVVAGACPTMSDGVARAADSIDSGAARGALDALVRVSSSVAR